MEKERSLLRLYGRVLIAFLISFIILVFLLIYAIHSVLIFMAFIFPSFFIFVFAVIAIIFILSKTRFRKSINNRKINILSVSIIVITILIALPTYSVIKSIKPPDELLGNWEFEEGQDPLHVKTNSNRKITRLDLSHDSTYNRNKYNFLNNTKTALEGCFEYDKSTKKITFYGFHDSSDWELTLKLKIDKTENTYKMTTYYVSDKNFPNSDYFDPILFDGLTWVKTRNW